MTNYNLYNSLHSYIAPPLLTHYLQPNHLSNLCLKNQCERNNCFKNYSQSPFVHSASSANNFSGSGKINADSGSTGTYIAVRDKNALTDIQPCTAFSRISVTVANGQNILSSHTGNLVVPSGHVLRAHIFSELNTSLLSISDLVDLGYRIIYSKLKVEFDLGGTVVFEGERDTRTGLWMVNFSVFNADGHIEQSASSATNVVPRLAYPAVEVNNQKDFVAYWHAAFGYPSKSTFVRNILNGNINITGLSAATVRRNFVPSVFTAMGHLDATRSNIRSTKVPFVSEANHSHKTPLVWMGVHKPTGRVHSDQTGALPILGKNKERLIAIFFDETSNYISAIPLPNKSSKSLLAATKQALHFFASHGSKTTVLRLDNEISDSVKDFLRKENVTIDLTPVGQHRRNKAERAIRTYKNHHIATLSGADKDCPLELWSDFLEQIEFTLNILRTSSSGQSAWSTIHGPYDLNKSPIAPLGVKVVAHVPAQSRGTWAQHGDVGFYVGRALDHYRCYKVWIIKTKSYRISDCLSWYPVFNSNSDQSSKASSYPVVPPGFEPLPQHVSPTPTLPVTGGKERVPAATGGKERVSVTPEVIIQNPSQLVHNKRNRLDAHYVPLSESEMHRLPISTVNKIGKHFVDATDAPDIYEGTIAGICRDRKSKSICYKYYDPNVHASAPRNKNDYLYIVVKLAQVRFSFPSHS